MKKFIAILLIPCLLLCFSAVPTVDAAEDNQIREVTLIGFALVVVGLVVVLGIRSDREWRAGLDREDYLRYAQSDESTFQMTGDGFTINW